MGSAECNWHPRRTVYLGNPTTSNIEETKKSRINFDMYLFDILNEQ